jgi:hypothetical protein
MNLTHAQFDWVGFQNEQQPEAFNLMCAAVELVPSTGLLIKL